MIGVPDIGAVCRWSVFGRFGATPRVSGWNELCRSVGCGHHEQSHGDAHAESGRRAQQISLLFWCLPPSEATYSGVECQNDVPPPNLNCCTISYLPLVSGTA